jgi:hypothetical protein
MQLIIKSTRLTLAVRPAKRRAKPAGVCAFRGALVGKSSRKRIGMAARPVNIRTSTKELSVLLVRPALRHLMQTGRNMRDNR